MPELSSAAIRLLKRYANAPDGVLSDSAVDAAVMSILVKYRYVSGWEYDGLHPISHRITDEGREFLGVWNATQSRLIESRVINIISLTLSVAALVISIVR